MENSLIVITSFFALKKKWPVIANTITPPTIIKAEVSKIEKYESFNSYTTNTTHLTYYENDSSNGVKYFREK